MFPQSGQETSVVREASHEPSNILDVPDLVHFSNGQDFVVVCFDVVHGDDVPQKLVPWDTEGALFWVQFDVETFEAVEGFFMVGDETVALSGLLDDVLDIDLQVVPYLPFETELHTPLVCGSCVV
jgi:hypothetical protein